MNENSQGPKRREVAVSSLNAAIDALNLVKEAMDMTPIKAAFGSVSVILTMIRVRFLLFCNDPPQGHT